MSIWKGLRWGATDGVHAAAGRVATRRWLRRACHVLSSPHLPRTASVDQRAFPQHSSDDKLFGMPMHPVHRACSCKQHCGEPSRNAP